MNDDIPSILRGKGYFERSPGVWEKPKREACNSGVCPDNKERPQGHSLERPAPRENKSRTRVKISFTVFSVRPADYDNYHIKELQDCLVRSGILDGDEWDILQGETVSEKVHSKSEERTEILIQPV